MHLNVSSDLNYISRTVTVTEHSGAEAPAELYLKVKALRPCTQQTVHQYVSVFPKQATPKTVSVGI